MTSAYAQEAAFYASQADNCDERAGGADLSNVRDRWLQAAAAWRLLGNRSRRVEAARQKSEATLRV